MSTISVCVELSGFNTPENGVASVFVYAHRCEGITPEARVARALAAVPRDKLLFPGNVIAYILHELSDGAPSDCEITLRLVSNACVLIKIELLSQSVEISYTFDDQPRRSFSSFTSFTEAFSASVPAG